MRGNNCLPKRLVNFPRPFSSVTSLYNSKVQQLDFWWHPKVLHSKSRISLKDGVHLNRMGYHLLFCSYQKALFSLVISAATCVADVGFF